MGVPPALAQDSILKRATRMVCYCHESKQSFKQVILYFYFALDLTNYKISLAYDINSRPYHAKSIAIYMSCPALGFISKPILLI